MIKDIIYIIIIISLITGWGTAVVQQASQVDYVTGIYNHLVNECNTLIGVYDKKDFCVNLPDGNIACNQNDLNILIPFAPN